MVDAWRLVDMDQDSGLEHALGAQNVLLAH